MVVSRMSARDMPAIVTIYQHFKYDTMNAFTDGRHVGAKEERNVEMDSG